MKKPLLIFAAGLLSRIILIALEPVIFGGDTILRLVNHDRIVISYQLPLLQAIIHGLSALTLEPMAARLAMASIGALMGVGFYNLAGHFVAERWASWGAILCSLHPFLQGLSTVPYQEPLMLAALFFAFHFLLSDRAWASSIAIGLACLTRYEAWAACPVFAIEYVIRRKPSAIGKAALLYGWAPAAWLWFSGGLSPQGSFVLEIPFSLERLVRYVYLGWITAKFTPLPVVILALLGFWHLAKSRDEWPKWRAPAGFLAVFLIAILFSAHGVGPDPERFVTSREACIPIAFVVLLSAVGLSRLERWTTPLLIVSIAWTLAGSYWYLHGETSKPELRLSYALARYLDLSAGEGQVLILAPHTPRDLIQDYLDRAFRSRGAAGLEAAKSELEQARLEPIDFLRTLVQARKSRNRLLGTPTPRFWRTPVPARNLPAAESLQWIAVWSNYKPEDAGEASYANALRSRLPTEVETLRQDGLTVTILRSSRP